MLLYERFFTKLSEELLKLRPYEKATKFKKSTTGGRFLNIFVTFLENLNLKQIIQYPRWIHGFRLKIGVSPWLDIKIRQNYICATVLKVLNFFCCSWKQLFFNYMKMSRKRMTGYFFSDYLGIYFSFYNLREKKKYFRIMTNL